MFIWIRDSSSFIVLIPLIRLIKLPLERISIKISRSTRSAGNFLFMSLVGSTSFLAQQPRKRSWERGCDWRHYGGARFTSQSMSVIPGDFHFQADVVAQTHISYPAKELLQLLHSHLLSQGLRFLSLFFFPGSGKNISSNLF